MGTDTSRGGDTEGGRPGEAPKKRGRPPGETLYGLKEARIEADLDGAELAAMAGMHVDTIGRLENVHRGADPRTTRRLARALGVEPRTLRQPPESS